MYTSGIVCNVRRFVTIMFILTCIIQTLQNRRRQFQSSIPESWSSTRKQHIKLILNEGLVYVSSEESGEDDGKPVNFRRPLYWLKAKYRKSLRQLDKLHYGSLSTKSKQMYHARSDGAPSTRAPPSKVPECLLVSSQHDLDSSMMSNATDKEPQE